MKRTETRTDNNTTSPRAESGVDLLPDKHAAEKIPKIAILYDHLETLLVASQVVDKVTTGKEGHAELAVNSWRFDLLTPKDESERALRDTSDAGLMIVAMGDTQALRTWPAGWLTRWVASRAGAAAVLVFLLTGTANPVDAASSVVAPLLPLAQKSHLDVFVMDDTQRTLADGLSSGLAMK